MYVTMYVCEMRKFMVMSGLYKLILVFTLGRLKYRFFKYYYFRFVYLSGKSRQVLNEMLETKASKQIPP